MIQIHVALLNGNPELLTLPPSSTVQDVRTKAQRAFGKKYLKLVTAKNRVLADPDKTLEEAEIKDGECLTAVILQPRLAATKSAFALWCPGDSAIVTWGDPRYGGDSSDVQDQLRTVQQIASTYGAFAAILEDGSVVTWGHEHFGGDSSAVRDQLKGVQLIQATEGAFATILANGGVVTWGLAGGDSSAVRDQLKGVQQIQATRRAFAAILADGSVVTWGWKTLAVTVRQFKISSRVCSRFKPHMGPLLRFWQMDPPLPGASQTVAVTVLQFKISSGVCSTFRPQVWHLPPF